MSSSVNTMNQSNRSKNMKSDEEESVISRKPKHYRPEGNHFFQSYHDRGGKADNQGVESWIITYLIEHGSVHHSKDEGRYVFKGYIKDQTGTERRWWLPVQKKNGQPNLIVTAPYVRGLSDLDMKLLTPVKPPELK